MRVLVLSFEFLDIPKNSRLSSCGDLILKVFK